MKEGSVSVIIPFFNGSACLAETLQSVKDQTYTNWEVIIVDDHSDMDEWNNAKQNESENIKIFRRQGNNKGPSACRNEGVKLSTGDFIIFLDADDILENFCLEQRIKLMKEHPEADWSVFGQYRFADRLSEKNIFTKAVSDRTDAVNYFLQLDPPWQTMASFWKRKTFEQMGGFDEGLVYMEDPDLHLRTLLVENVKPAFGFDLPPDSYYRLAELSDAKKDVFYDRSIIYRFKFLYKHVPQIRLQKDQLLHRRYIKSLRTGYFSFVKGFLLHRLKKHFTEFTAMNKFLSDQSVLSKTDLLLLKWSGKIFNSDSPVVQKLRLRGIANKFF